MPPSTLMSWPEMLPPSFTGEEDAQARDVVVLGNAFEGGPGGDGVVDLLQGHVVLLGEHGQPWSFDAARADAVDGDVVLADLQSERPGDPDHRHLRGAIGGALWQGSFAGD